MVDKEVLYPLMTNDEAYPTEETLNESGFGIYTFGEDESKEYICPVYDQPSSGEFTGRVRYYYRGVAIDEEKDYTVIGKVENGRLKKCDLNLADTVLEGKYTIEELAKKEKTTGVGATVFYFVLAAGFGALTVVFIRKARYE